MQCRRMFLSATIAFQQSHVVQKLTSTTQDLGPTATWLSFCPQAEERQRHHEERQKRRAPRRHTDWSANTPGNRRQALGWLAGEGLVL